MTALQANTISPRTKIAPPWCATCRHRGGGMFKDLSQQEATFMASFKLAHGRAPAGEILIRQNVATRKVFTLYSGLAAKYREVPSGDRQLLSVMLPGDLIGLEGLYTGKASHSVEALTDVTFCMFDADRWPELLAIPSLAKRVSWLQALDQRHAEERLMAIGACDARRSIGYFVLDLYIRLQRRRLYRDNSFALPLTQQQFADAVGLTTVHVHRTLRCLHEENILTVEHKRATILDMDALRELACVSEDLAEERPFI